MEVPDKKVQKSNDGKDPDLVTLVSSFGKGIGTLLAGKGTRKRPEPSPQIVDIPKADSGARSSFSSFGEVFANKKATSEIYFNRPKYPVGSIIVREKHDDRVGPLPQVVIAMVKREAGFSPDTGDWEFFMFDGRTLALQLREKTGDCAACHARAKETDWSFRTYMNFTQ